MLLEYFQYKYSMYDYEVYSIFDYFCDEVFSIQIYHDGRYSILINKRSLTEEELNELKLIKCKVKSI
jgi:hypothetical protein